MTNLDDVEKRLTELILHDHAVPVLLKGLRGSSGLFSALLPEVPRPGDVVLFRLKHRRGQGEYLVTRVEWIVGGYGEVIIHLHPAT